MAERLGELLVCARPRLPLVLQLLLHLPQRGAAVRRLLARLLQLLRERALLRLQARRALLLLLQPGERYRGDAGRYRGI